MVKSILLVNKNNENFKIYNKNDDNHFKQVIKNCEIFPILDINMILSQNVINNILMILKSEHTEMYDYIIDMLILMLNANSIRKKIINSDIYLLLLSNFQYYFDISKHKLLIFIGLICGSTIKTINNESKQGRIYIYYIFIYSGNIIEIYIYKLFY